MCQPLTTRVACSSTSNAKLFALTRAVAEWRQPPTYWSGGRAGWIVVPDHLASTRLRGLKFKGLGSPPSRAQPARIPSSDPYDRWDGQPSDPHFGISDDGEFCLREGDPAPVGGLCLESAVREQQCSRALVKAGVPTVAPIAAFSYDRLVFSSEGRRVPLAVSVTASPLHQDTRCSAIMTFEEPNERDDRTARELDRVCQALGISASSSGAPGRLKILGAVYEALGRTLRAFSAAGWYRYSSHPGNVTIDQNGAALLVDLDSCRDMRLIKEERASLEAVRDGMSALYNLSCTFYSSEALLHIDDASLVDNEPFSGFLAGWDPSAEHRTNRADGRAIAQYVVAARARLRHFAAFLESDLPAATHLYRYVRHDRDVTYCGLMRLLARRRLQRPTDLPLPYDGAELDLRLRRFAGYERFERLGELDGS